MNAVLHPVAPMSLSLMRDELEARLQRVVDKGLESDCPTALVNKGISGLVHFWLVLDNGKTVGLLVTENVPRINTNGELSHFDANLLALEGEGADVWLGDVLDQVQAHMEALPIDVRGFSMRGRLGWVKKAQKYGFEARTYAYRSFRNGAGE